MARRCSLTGKGVMTGNNVSHAHNKTRRRFLPNLQVTALYSETLGRTIRLRLTAHALRSVEHKGGIDAFLLDAKETALSPGARRFRRQIQKSRAAAS